ncbi:Rieske (2Fe-2S) protein [Streptomyces sp. NBC_00233]|uniref:Rieske (2Fe-2S) protein n=1 Tax=Streptomyces sp. NBC_00233 TaxID=2975686 RepID=UPI00338DE401
MEEKQHPTRRSVTGAIAAAAVLTSVAGCGSTPQKGTVSGVAAEKSQELAREDEVPRGGGLIVGHANVVLTRNSEGQLRAFSAICTHRGCTVASVTKGHIECPCHGSRFDINTGAPLAGPAKEPLPPVRVDVHDGIIKRV